MGYSALATKHSKILNQNFLILLSMKYIKLYAISRPKLTFECYLKFEFTFYALKPENFA